LFFKRALQHRQALPRMLRLEPKLEPIQARATVAGDLPHPAAQCRMHMPEPFATLRQSRLRTLRLQAREKMIEVLAGCLAALRDEPREPVAPLREVAQEVVAGRHQQ